MNCHLCGHSMKNNSHGFDQNDAWMDGDKLVHLGQCTYCKVCQFGDPIGTGDSNQSHSIDDSSFVKE